MILAKKIILKCQNCQGFNLELYGLDGLGIIFFISCPCDKLSMVLVSKEIILEYPNRHL